MKRLLIVAALTALPVANVFAADVGGFVSAGILSRDVDIELDDDGTEINLERGSGYSVSGGLAFAPGIMVRATVNAAKHDGADGCTPFACGSTDDEIETEETRIGLFYVSNFGGPVDFSAGAGYERVGVDSLGGDSDATGPFVEGSVQFHAGRVVTFDLGAALMALEGDNDEDLGGAEFRVGATFHAGPIDIGLSGRSFALVADNDDGSETTYSILDAQLTLGTRFGYLR